jgi:muramoyltetrapeptide carboxypeptidase
MKEIIFPKSLKKEIKLLLFLLLVCRRSTFAKTLNLIKSKGYEPVFGKHTLGKFSNGYNYSGTKKKEFKI